MNLNEVVDAYLVEKVGQNKPPTFFGLCARLRLTGEEVKALPQFDSIMNRMRAIIEEGMLTGNITPHAGIFWLKNNSSMVDKVERDVNVKTDLGTALHLAANRLEKVRKAKDVTPVIKAEITKTIVGEEDEF